MKLNHLGIATKNIKKADEFVRNTHDVINSLGPIWDPNLNANLKLLEINNGIAIELVEGPVVNSLIKKGITLYHFCYEVDDINVKINQFKSKKSINRTLSTKYQSKLNKLWKLTIFKSNPTIEKMINSI